MSISHQSENKQIRAVNGDGHPLRARSMKTAQLATLVCASLMLFNSPLAAAQEKVKAKAQAQTQTQTQTQASQSVADKKAAVQAHAEALQLVRGGENAKAAELLAPYAKQPLANVPLTGDYLVFLIWSGNNLQATKEFENLPASFPKSSYLLRNVAKAYYDQNNFAPAAALYADALKVTSGDEEAQKGHVLSLFHAGKKEDAAARLNEYLKSNPDSTTLQYLKPQILQ